MIDRLPPSSDDPLERELGDLRPIDLSGNVRRGIGAELAPLPIGRSRMVLRFAAGALAAAACVAIGAVIFHQTATSPRPHAGAGAIVKTLPGETDAPLPAPTLGELRLALARSPEAAEALLAGGSRTPGEPARLSPRAFGPVASSTGPAEPKF